MSTPTLKQFAELSPEDLERHPVWVHCHSEDYGEPWYDDTDEETFRPWDGSVPIEPGMGMFLVRAWFVLNDGSRLPGFVTPSHEPGDLGSQQPQVFVANRPFGFWGGMLGVPAEGRVGFYAQLAKTPSEVFPAQFEADRTMATGACSGVVEGFYRLVDFDTGQVECDR